jgi:membrane associated rhomboid family serine protease
MIGGMANPATPATPADPSGTTGQTGLSSTGAAPAAGTAREAGEQTGLSSTGGGRPRAPVVTYALIALCALAFAVSPLSGLVPHGGCAAADFVARWGMVPRVLWHGARAASGLGTPRGCPAVAVPGVPGWPAVTVLTALFVHGGWVHLLGNLLFLHVFGGTVEDAFGRAGFALLYLASGVLACCGFALAYASSPQALIGASGAISGVLGAHLRLSPRARVTSLFPFLFFLPLRLPAWLVLCFWFVLQWMALRTAPAAPGGPGVAYLAHVVGFTFGFGCAWVWPRRRDGRSTRLGPPRATQGELQP